MQTTNIFRILIADDDFEDLEFFRFLFENHPNFHIVDTLSCGSDIINLINRLPEPPDILLTDQLMPIITGTDAVKHLIKNKVATNMDVFIISGSDNPRLREEFSPHEHVRFLLKPKTLVEYNDLPDQILKQLNTDNIYRV